MTRDAAKEVLSCQYLAGSPIEINFSKELIPTIDFSVRTNSLPTNESYFLAAVRRGVN